MPLGVWRAFRAGMTADFCIAAVPELNLAADPTGLTDQIFFSRPGTRERQLFSRSDERDVPMCRIDGHWPNSMYGT